MSFTETIELTGHVVDAVGIAIMVLGGLAALLPYLVHLATRTATVQSYRTVRRNLGRAILLGLEFLVAADIIRTVTISPTLDSVAALGLIVLIRIVLSTALEVEIEGEWPWRKGRRAEAAGNQPAA